MVCAETCCSAAEFTVSQHIARGSVTIVTFSLSFLLLERQYEYSSPADMVWAQAK